MTEQQLKMAKVLDEVELPRGGRLVLLDMRTVGVVNVFPQFAVYEQRDMYYFVAGSNDKSDAWRAFQTATEKKRKQERR